MSWLDTYREIAGVRLNMVANGDRKFVGPDGSSRSISNPTDRELIVHLRSISDVYVTGGNTARNEHYTTPTKGKLAIISQTSLGDSNQIWLNPPEGESLPNWVIEELWNHGYQSVLLEVGPTLAKQFLESDSVDEFCLTITEGNLETAKDVVAYLGGRLALAEHFEVTGTLFTKWRRGNE
jgi:riboflavin biosynthesis pyrimidine reductase